MTNFKVFIGGSPCSGKSTVCNYLASKYKARAYHCDGQYENHLLRAQEGSILASIKHLEWHDLFVNKKSEIMAHKEFAANLELGVFAIQDVDDIQKPTFAEGMPFLPSLAHGCNLNIVFLIPTREFQWASYSQRDWIHGLLESAPNPRATFNNWMERDYLNGKRISDEASKYGYPILQVDGSLPVTDTANWVVAQFPEIFKDST
ncbi:MAG: hypothetical protein AAF267_06410 [Deinococcota bacterium]